MEGASCQFQRNVFVSVAILISVTSMQEAAEVTPNIVETDTIVKLQNGTIGFVPCRVSIQPIAVQWSKGPSFPESTFIMSFEPSFIKNERWGPGYDDGTYNMTEDFTLVINEVTFENEKVYFCEVIYDIVKSVHNESSVSVYVLPQEPYPSIDTCLTNTSKHLVGQNCSLYKTQSSHNITCLMSGYTPNLLISLYFRHQSHRMDILDTREWSEDSITISKAVTIQANASFYPYECIAFRAESDVDERVASILIRQRPVLPGDDVHHKKDKALITVSFFIACIFPLFVLYLTVTKWLLENVGTIVCLGVIFCLGLVLPYAMIALGVLYKNDCPAEELIPVYLIAMGTASIVSVVILLKFAYHDEQPEEESDKFETSLTHKFLFCLWVVSPTVLVVFLICGNVWIYRIVWPNMSDPTSPEYCHRTLYLFSFWLTTSIDIIIGLIIAVIVTLIIIAIIIQIITKIRTRPVKFGTETN